MGRRGAIAGVAVAAIAVTGGCGSTSGDDPGGRSAAVYEAILSEIVAEEFPDADEPTPVVYALPDGPEPIAADVQAAVANSMKDDVDVRFADARADVVDEHDEREPVEDDAVLVLLGPVPDEGRRIDVTVEVYRTQSDQRALVVTLMRTGDRWAIRATEPA